MKKANADVIFEDIVRTVLNNGFSLGDLKELTVGMLIDYCVALDNQNVGEDDAVYATKADIDAF